MLPRSPAASLTAEIAENDKERRSWGSEKEAQDRRGGPHRKGAPPGTPRDPVGVRGAKGAKEDKGQRRLGLRRRDGRQKRRVSRKVYPPLAGCNLSAVARARRVNLGGGGRRKERRMLKRVDHVAQPPSAARSIRRSAEAAVPHQMIRLEVATEVKVRPPVAGIFLHPEFAEAVGQFNAGSLKKARRPIATSWTDG